MKEWGVFMGFENEVKYYDLFHQDKDYKAEAKKIKKKYPRVKTILEIGAGTGNLTRQLEDLGYDVTCIEPSKEMLEYFKGRTNKVYRTTIQEYIPPRKKFGLVLAMYDILNYVPDSDYGSVMDKINKIGRLFYFETWDPSELLKNFTHKVANGCHRIRLGLEFRGNVHLWFIFWGKGLVISKHKLYL